MLLELAVGGATAVVTATRPCDRESEPTTPAGTETTSRDAALVDAIIHTAAGERTSLPDRPDPRREPGTRALVCAVPVVDLEVTLELPSGSILQGSTDRHGVVTFVVSTDEPAGPLVARAGAISTPIVAWPR